MKKNFCPIIKLTSVLIASVLLSSSLYAQAQSSPKPGYIKYGKLTMPWYEITYDIVAVKITKVKEAPNLQPRINYTIVKYYRQHPNLKRRVPRTGIASLSPYWYEGPAKSYKDPAPPKEGEKVILLGCKSSKSVLFLDIPLHQKKFTNKDGSVVIPNLSTSRSAKGFTKYPDQEKEALEFIKRCKKARLEWLSTITRKEKVHLPSDMELFKVEPSNDGLSLKQYLNGAIGTYFGGYDARSERYQ